MKILYIGHYKEGSGWSQAAIDYILALDSIGIDVVCRNVKLTNYDPQIPERILELEQKKINNIDFCIQHVLPHHIVGTNKFKKNIACFVTESNTINYSNWHTHLKQVDEIWVPNNQCRDVLISDSIKDKDHIKTIPYAFDTIKYQNIYNKLNFGIYNNTFKFYTILDLNDRKNIESTIRAFNSEFYPDENVSLILKVKKYGMDVNQLSNHTHNLISNIKKKLRIHMNKEAVFPGNMSQDEIYSLHYSCDCFVNPSHGEGWSIPSFEAMCFGKTPICSNEGGPKDFIDESNKNTGYLINGVYSVCEHGDPAFQDIFTGRESWFVASESEIKSAMRFYYENRKNINHSEGLKRGMNFNYFNVANKIKDTLNDS